MKNSFNKLKPGESINGLKISEKNQKFIDRVLKIKGDCDTARISKYRNALTRFCWLVEKDLDKLTKEEVAVAGAIINKSDLAVKTKQDIVSEVRSAFKLLFGEGEYFPTTVSLLKPPKSKGRLRLPEEMPSEKDIFRMIKACQNSRDKFIIALVGLDGALRPIELRKILWRDVKKDKHSHFITIKTAKKSGDKETRTVRIIKSEPYFLRWMEDYPAEKEPENYVFVNFDTLGQMNHCSLTKLFNRLKEKLKWKYKLTPYVLRHAYITRASKNPQWSMPLLKKFIGHSQSSNTIAEYQHFGDDDIMDAQLHVNGIVKTKTTKEEEVKPITCPRCQKSNEHDAEVCRFCQMVLSQKRMVEIQEEREKNNKEMYEMVKEIVRRELENAVNEKSKG